MPSTSDIVAAQLPDARLTSSGWWVMPCPFCTGRVGTPGRGRKLGVRDDTGVFHCFRCGIVGKLAGRASSHLKRLTDKRSGTTPPPSNEAFTLPHSFCLLADEPGASALSLEDARAYVASRNVPVHVQRAAGIGACALGRFAGRVIVPVRPDPDRDVVGDPGGAVPEVWGYIGRAWVPKSECDAPYMYPAGMPRGLFVYNQRALWEVTEEPAGVVEGSFDTFPIHPDGVGILGDLGDATDDQFWLMVDARRPVCAVPDGDAWERGLSLALRLRVEGQRAGCVLLPPKMDPDEVPPDVLRDAMRRAVEADDAVWSLR